MNERQVSSRERIKASLTTHLGRLSVTTEQTPLDVSTIAEVGRVCLGGSESENALDEGLRRLGALEEELDDGGESLQLDL